MSDIFHLLVWLPQYVVPKAGLNFSYGDRITPPVTKENSEVMVQYCMLFAMSERFLSDYILKHI